MPNDAQSASDEVEVEQAEEEQEVKGPDPAQWPVEDREESDSEFEPTEGDEVKGPDPDVWGEPEEDEDE